MTEKSDRIIFIGILIVIPILFFLFLESGLRLIHFGYDLRLFSTYTNNPDFQISNPKVALRYFSKEGQTGFGGNDVFRTEKGNNTLRLFVLGGSTTAGFPYFFNARFSNHIKIRLQDAYPDYNIEVVNLGMTAVNSYTVREFAQECLNYDPDLILIYTGHNEFYGALGSGSSQRSLFGNNRGLTLFTQWIKHLKITQLLQTMVRLFRSQETNGTNNTGTLMARMVKDQAIPHRGKQYHQTLDIFKRNMQDILGWTQAMNVPVLLGTLVSNLRNQKPFVSIHGITADEQAFQKELERAKSLMSQQKYGPALRLLEHLMEQDSTYALTYFYAGRCAELLGDYETARNHYSLARDFDGLRFRASSDLNATIRDLASQEGVTLIDLEAVFVRESPNHIPGNSLFLEHLHPNLDGYFLMGKAFTESILSQNLLRIAHQSNLPEPRALKSDQHYRQAIAVTPLDLKIAEYQMETLLSGWPFKDSSHFKPISSIQPHTTVDEVALDALKKKKNYWEAHLTLVDHYTENRSESEALAECAALVAAFPHTWKSYKVLGRTLITFKRFDQALPAFLKVLESEEDAFSSKWVGTILINHGQHNKAIPYLETACNLQAEDYQARYNLSGAYYFTGQKEKAILELETLLKVAPDFPNAKSFYEQLKNH